MGKWPMVRLGDVCTINMGQSPSSESYNDVKDGIPFYQGNADFGEVHPKARLYCNKPIKIANKNDVLLSVRAPIGALNIANEKCCIGRGLCAITEKENVSYYKYIYYVLKRKKEELIAKGTGSTFKAINKTSIQSIKIPLPPLDVQKHIADTLDKTQEIIAGYKKQLVKLDNLIMAVFYEMFGDIRLNKKKWARTKIGEVCHDNIKKLSGNEKIEISYVDISAISNTEKEIISVKNINSKDAPSRAKQILELNDILVSTVRPNLNAVAINNINTGKKVIGSTGFCVLRCKSTINYRYLFEIVKSDYFIDKLVSLARGASYPAVTDYDVKNIDIPIPPLDLQNKFAEIVAKIEEQKALVKQAITESEHLFKSLMSEYFD